MNKTKRDDGRKEWLSTLKSGDEVALVAKDDKDSFWFNNVTRRRQWFSIGRCRFGLTDGRSLCCEWQLAPITAEMRHEKRMLKLRHEVSEKIGSFCHGISDEQTLAIAAILWPNGQG